MEQPLRGHQSGQASGQPHAEQRVLRVTTWNILAPVIDVGKMFPFVGVDVTGQEHRSAAIARHIESLETDVWLLQELPHSQLEELLAGPAQGFESYFVHEGVGASSVDAGVSGNIGGTDLEQGETHPARQRGVAVLWKRGLFESVTKMPETRTDAGNPAAMIRARWRNRDIVLGSKHMDALGCPPAATRCQAQLKDFCKAASDFADSATTDIPSPAVVLGGDCNLTPSAPAMAEVHNYGFTLASDELHKPTCFAVTGSTRLDHIFVYGSVQGVSTKIPDCELGHPCNVVPCFHQLQMLMDLIGVSRPKIEIRCQVAVACLLAPVFFVAAVCCFCIPAPLSLRRCRWALEHFGSDHLPVTVTVVPREDATAGTNTVGAEVGC